MPLPFLLAVAALVPLPRTIPVPDPIQAFAVSPDGRHFACARDTNWADIYDTATGEKRHSCRCADGDFICTLAFSPNGKVLAAGARHTNVVRTWDVATGDPLLTPTANTGGVNSLAFTPDGKQIVTGGEDGQIVVLDAISGEKIVALNATAGVADRITAIAVHPNGRFVVATTAEAAIRGSLWRIRPTSRKLRSLATVALGDRMLAFSPDGRSVVSYYDGQVRVFEAVSGKRRWSAAVRDGVTTVEFAPDGRSVVAACEDGQDGRVRSWDADTGRPLHVLRPHPGAVVGLAFADGRLFTAGDDQTVRVRPWFPATRALVPLKAEDRPSVLRRIRGPDAEAAFVALGRLATDPDTAIGLAREHLKPVPPVDAKLVADVRRIVARLGADSFDDRQAAERELAPLVRPALPELWRLRRAADPEAAYRLDRVLVDFDPDRITVPDARWLELLERVGTRAAADVVRGIAAGDPDAALTRDAAETLGRMAVRGR